MEVEHLGDLWSLHGSHLLFGALVKNSGPLLPLFNRAVLLVGDDQQDQTFGQFEFGNLLNRFVAFTLGQKLSELQVPIVLIAIL